MTSYLFGLEYPSLDALCPKNAFKEPKAAHPKTFEKLNLDTKEVLDAASTKWNFLNFKPGLVGGHCVSVDPYYMISLCKNKHIDCDLIKVARNINQTMYKFVAKDFSKKIKKTTTGKKN